MKRILAAGLMAAALVAGAHAQEVFLPQDANHDDFQSTDELIAWYSGFITKLDANGDGVSKAEFSQLYESQVQDGSFSKADANKDGKLEGAEITAMAAIIAKTDMDFCDTDKDGRISNAENAMCTSGETVSSAPAQ